MEPSNDYVAVFKRHPSSECLLHDDCGRGVRDSQIQFLEKEIVNIRKQRNILAITLFVVMVVVAFFHKYI